LNNNISFLILDQGSLEVLDTALIDRQWFEEFKIPKNLKKIKRVHLGKTLFILHEDCNEDSPLLIIDLKEVEISNENKRAAELFQRIIRVALHCFNREVSIPSSWGSYKSGSIISIFCSNSYEVVRKRIYFETNLSGVSEASVYAFSVSEKAEAHSELDYNKSKFRLAIKNYEEAALTDAPILEHVQNFGIVLSDSLGTQVSGLASLDIWYSQKITAEQKAFIDHPLTSPVRLKGAAGTGKTQSIAIKCLVDLAKLEEKKQPAKLAVITHSWALAHEIIRGMMEAMDPKQSWMQFKYASIWFGTLYELAEEWMSYNSKGLQPLSSDGREGRGLQKILIEDAVKEIESQTSFGSRLTKCSDTFAELVRNHGLRDQLVEELMNEFACIIDAENISLGSEAGESYLSRKRDPWNWELPIEMDRQLVLEIHQSYIRELEQSNFLSMDQMMADFNRYLLTHGWRQLRESNGFDAIFVDEYHYFNRSECMSMHHLLKSNAGENGKKPIFMAYDLKQGPNDVALTHSSSSTQNFMATRAGSSELVELTKVFRSTPEIMDFMRDIDGSHPTLNMEMDWSPLPTETLSENGAKPILLQYNNDIALVDNVSILVKKAIAGLDGGGRDVAVLCMNERLFDIYRDASRINDFALPITSREQMKELRYARRKCVFSMPEYIAGLQFDTVVIIHADEKQYNNDIAGPNALRRFVSRFYLAATRAKKNLIVCSSNERGGPSSILAGAISAGSISVS
tara:strand:+ start:1070 stop:3292 length:2223 start_codon:yes stop_codon:yes gene_type:complete